MPPAVVIGGKSYPPALSTAQAAEILRISEEACRRRCVAGKLPLLGRYGREAWRIPAGRLCQELGLAYETVTEAEAS